MIKKVSCLALYHIYIANVILQIKLHIVNSVTMSAKVKTICLKFSLAVAFLLFQQVAKAQKNFSETDKAIEAKKAVLGNEFIVVITSKDSILWQKAYGDFNNKTVAPIQAASQWFTTALIMQLVDEGKLSLDDKVSKYLPVFEQYGKAYITLRQCLSHQTGIQSQGTVLQKIFERKKFNSLDDEMLEFARKEIQTNPGTEFRYSNIGINIAGKVAEVVTKKKFDALMKQRFFSPLAMRNTTFSVLDLSAPDPSAGAKSTAADYAKFLVMLLANGKVGDKQYLSEAAITEMRKQQVTKEQIKFAPKGMEGLIYALGSWDLTPGPSPSEMARGAAGANMLACPSLFGTWPIVDFSRGYAVVFFVKKEVSEQSAAVYLELKKVMDKQFQPVGKK